MLKPRLWLILVGIAFCASQCLADDMLVYMTQEGGGFKVYYSLNGANWVSYNVPPEITSVRDVEYNPTRNSFYFSSTQVSRKGLWKTNITMGSPQFTHQLRDDSSPISITAYPEYDAMLFYDEGYSLVIGISLYNEFSDLRIKSLFGTSERLEGTFYLDTKRNRVYAQQQNDTRGILLATALNGTFAPSLSFPARAMNAANALAYDSNNDVLYFCKDSFVNAMSLGDPTVNYQVNLKLACNLMTSDNGNVLYTNPIINTVQRVSFTPSGVLLLNESFARLPFPVNPSVRPMSFKYYNYDPNNVVRYCDDMYNDLCSQICLPPVVNGKGSCVCMDYYSLAAKNDTTVNANDPDQCKKDSLHGPSIFYAVFNISFAKDATLFYRLGGDPAVWTRRPQREQLFTISSDVAAVAYDWQNQRIFSAALRYRQIMSASMDGTFSTAGHYSGISTNIKSMGYDWVGNNIIWFDPNFRWLRIVPLNRSGGNNFAVPMSTLFKTVRIRANIAGYGLKLDAVAGFLFFLDYDDNTLSISLFRTLMDGSEATDIYNFPSTVFSTTLSDTSPDVPLPGGIAVDYKNRHVWIAFSTQLFVVDYNGRLVYQSAIGLPGNSIFNTRVGSIALFSTTHAIVVFLRTDIGSSTMVAYAVARNLRDGVTPTQLIQTYTKPIFALYRGMINYEEQPQAPASLNCASMNCAFICTNIKGAATCICPDGFVLDSSQRNCTRSDRDSFSTATVVFTASDRICHRALTDQTNWNGRNILALSDNCTSIGFLSGTVDSPKAIAPDILTFRAFVVQIQSNPRQVFSVNLTAASQGNYGYNFMTPFGQLSQFIGGGNWSATSSDVFYSAVTPGARNVNADVAFDYFGRNVYLADQSNGRLLVVRDDFTSPLILMQNTNFTAIAVDQFRRKLYYSVGSATGSTSIFQRDLDGASNECLVARTQSDEVVQLVFVPANQTILALLQPSNSIARIQLKRLPPFTSCPSSPLPMVTTQLAKPNVTQIAAYQATLLFACGPDANGRDSNNCGQRIFSSLSGGQTVDAETIVFQSGQGPVRNGVFLTSLAVFDPALLLISNTSYAINDVCSSMSRGRCEVFCLGSWLAAQNRTNGQCACPDGQRLITDRQTCAPRNYDLNQQGAIFTPDDYRHDIYSVPLTTLDNPEANIKDILTTYNIHAKARPYAVAYDNVADMLYYSDFDRSAIYRISPKKQMSRTAGQLSSNEVFLTFAPGSRVYGLFVDPISRNLFYTIRDQKALFVADMTKVNRTALVKDFSDLGGNIFGVTLDRRVDRMHLYIALRNNSQVLQTTNFSVSISGRPILMVRTNPTTWSAIMRCSIDGTNCTQVVLFNVSGPVAVQSVPWIYDMSIDYAANRLYFSTGQNRSIMYVDIDNWQAGPKVIISSAENSSFVYGCQVFGSNILLTDWGRGGIHVHDKATGTRRATIGPQFMIGINGLVSWSRLDEEGLKLNSACSNDRCSHVCVPMPGGSAKCLCPDGAPTVDGKNCVVPSCQLPDPFVGMFAKCDLSLNSYCEFTCASTQAIHPSARGKSTMLSCDSVNGTVQWCARFTDICPPPTVIPKSNPTVNCIPPVAMANTAGSSDDSSESSGGLNGGAVAGIVIAVLLVVAALVVVGFFLWKRYYVSPINHERFDLPPGANPSGGLPHLDELGMPDSFRYRNLSESHDNSGVTTSA